MDVRKGARRLRRGLAGRAGGSKAVAERVGALEKQVTELRDLVEQLDAELLDARSQSRRAGEVADLVTELLANEASRRDPEFRRIVAKFLDVR